MQVSLNERFDRVCLVVGCVLHWLVAHLPLPRDPDLWVFGARSGEAFADNAKYCYLHVAATHPEIRPVWLSKNRETVRQLQARGYEAYYTYSPHGLGVNLRAGVVLVTHGLRDVNLACSGGARAVLLWHGTPLKHISWDSHFPDESLPVRLAHAYAHRVLDLVTITAETMIPVFVSGLGVDPAVLSVTGYPRNDALFGSIPDADIGADSDVHRTVERLAADHPVVLYLPTFRDTDKSALDALDVPGLDESLEHHDAYLLVKTHPNDPLGSEPIDSDRIRCLPETTDSHSLLPLADALVTDYSSVFFDYLLLDRPTIFYAHDLERYRADRGFYFEYEDVTPGPVARTPEAFHDAIENILAHPERDEFADERARVRERFCHTRPNRAEAVFEAIRHSNGK